ncbi:calcineurin subunit B-like isoform X1 [Haliotis cracherodii]|uniref:calcineurin subunit B-like isoform X1 n=1 Tax=Haliotis cracherodii TaxID=6455 RepID=UPI0039E9C0F0
MTTSKQPTKVGIKGLRLKLWLELYTYFYGNASSALTEAQQRELAQITPFKQRDLERLLKRYADYDPSERGVRGITFDVCVTIPEFCGNKFVPKVIASYQDPSSKKIFPKQFLLICAVLSSKTPPQKKKEYLFDMFDVYKTNVFTHDEMFRIYKTLLGSTVTDDVILDLTFRALRHPDLVNEGEITKEEFVKMIPDNEIMQRMTVDL